MNNILEDEYFIQYISSLKDTSYNKNANTFLTNSDLQVINFDKVKDNFASDKKISSPSSVDALYYNNGILYFIEFKDAECKEHILHKKIYDSIIILSSKLNISVNEIVENSIYIVVYSSEKNKDMISKIYKNKDITSENFIENPNEYYDITNAFMKSYNQYTILFKLEQYKNYLFKDVYTISENTFNENKSNFIK